MTPPTLVRTDYHACAWRYLFGLGLGLGLGVRVKVRVRVMVSVRVRVRVTVYPVRESEGDVFVQGFVGAQSHNRRRQ